MSPQEVAEKLRLSPPDVVQLVEQDGLPAYRIGKFLQVADDELERWLKAQSTAFVEADGQHPPVERPGDICQPGDQVRRCPAFGGRTTFRVSGHVAAGVKIWPGETRYPVVFPKDRFDALLALGRAKCGLRVGAIFKDPPAGSLGEWIQQNLPTKMNPATYVAGLLVEEGYAEKVRPGVIRFFQERREAIPPVTAPSTSPKTASS